MDNLKLLDREQDWLKSKVKEAIHIKQRAPSMNRDQGYQLPHIYGSFRDHHHLSRITHLDHCVINICRGKVETSQSIHTKLRRLIVLYSCPHGLSKQSLVKVTIYMINNWLVYRVFASCAKPLTLSSLNLSLSSSSTTSRELLSQVSTCSA